MKWYNVELQKGKQADAFRCYLKTNGIRYESSETDNMIHFEVYTDEIHLPYINSKLDSITAQQETTKTA